MKLTTAEGYALRAMIFLARQAKGDMAFSLKDIAEQEHLPLPFLEQIFLSLKKNALVTSIRGARGGYRLGAPAKKITVLSILEAVSGKVSLLECNRDFCPDGNCSVVPFLLKLQHTIQKTLSTTRLSQLVTP